MNHIVGAGTFRLIESPYISSTYTIDGSQICLLGS
jgi:hypothetical protein